MIILGLNAYHGDSAACLMVDGELICAIEEERIRRQKHWAGLPSEAVKWCLNYAHIELKDVNYIAIGRNPYAHLDKKLFKLLTKRPTLSFVKNRLSNASKVGCLKAELCKALGIPKRGIAAKVKNIEHHKAHLASSYFVSPFHRAVCVSVDGFGDFVSVMRGLGVENKLKIKDAVYYPHSLGIFYTALTQYLGFPHYGDEYKVMGLSAMGKPDYLAEMRKIVKLKPDGLFELEPAYFTHDSKGVEMTWSEGSPSIAPIFSDKLGGLFGKPRGKEEPLTEHHRNIAASTQAMYEEAFFNLLNKTYEKYKIPELCLSGGCIQNSLANGRIFEKTKFNKVYIPPAAYDAGTAVGAAYWLWNETLGRPRTYVMDKPYFGPEYTNAEIEKVLKEKGVKYYKLADEELFAAFAKAMADGKITGWFQGRTEWGPRALGNRSIIVDPRRKEMKDVLNERVKRRETFRPFAPSILEEKAADWFEYPCPAPFMEKVYKIKEAKRAEIPAVAHLDGTGRLQTVSKEMNPRYHRLIKTFGELTGVPMVLNTSFNENEPIVNTPEDAVNCFLRVGMDLLAIGNYLIIGK